jgi:hypothetical protein
MKYAQQAQSGAHKSATLPTQQTAALGGFYDEMPMYNDGTLKSVGEYSRGKHPIHLSWLFNLITATLPIQPNAGGGTLPSSGRVDVSRFQPKYPMGPALRSSLPDMSKPPKVQHIQPDIQFIYRYTPTTN